MTVTPAPRPAAARPAGPNGWLVIGGVFTALLLIAGGLSAAGWLARRTETQTEVYRQVATSLSVELSTGDLTLTAGEAGQVSVERRLYWSWSFQKPIIDEQWDGQALRVKADCGNWVVLGPACGVDYALTVPEGISVQARTSTGDVQVSNILGALELSTSTGDIRVTGATGELRLDASTGDITVSDTRSTTVDASTSTGDVTIHFATAPRTVSADTSTGDVAVVVPDGDGYRVDTDTSTGDERVSVRRDDSSGRSIVARTSTGDIDISYG